MSSFDSEYKSAKRRFNFFFWLRMLIVVGTIFVMVKGFLWVIHNPALIGDWIHIFGDSVKNGKSLE